MLSPLLANVYLHEVLDTWCETVVTSPLPRPSGTIPLRGRCAHRLRAGIGCSADHGGLTETVRQVWAGDQRGEDHSWSTLVARSARQSGRKPGTFSFLGFVHYWGKTWRGGYTIKRKTEGKRLRRTLGEFWRWCRDNRHRPLQEQYALLCAKLRGYYQYYGVRCNSPCLDLVYYAATRAWRYWLNRRGGRKMTWRAFGRMMAAYPLPRPKIVKGWV